MSMFELDELQEMKRLAETRAAALKEAANKTYVTYPSVGDRISKRLALMERVVEKLTDAILVETRLKKKSTNEQQTT